MSFALSEAERFLSVIGQEFFDGAKDSQATDARLYRMVRKLRAAINDALDTDPMHWPKIARGLHKALDFDGREVMGEKKKCKKHPLNI